MVLAVFGKNAQMFRNSFEEILFLAFPIVILLIFADYFDSQAQQIQWKILFLYSVLYEVFLVGSYLTSNATCKKHK